jgi:hypothetical protein
MKIGLSIGLGVGAVVGAIALNALEKRNKEEYNKMMASLENQACNIPQCPEGEEIASTIGTKTASLKLWKEGSWIERALIPPSVRIRINNIQF